MIMNASLIRELRDISGAGMMDCKKALEENGNDVKKATEWLREKGIAKAAKKAGRIAAEGLSTVIEKDNKAVIVEINCETDFVAKNEKFQKFVDDVARTILASNAKTNEEALALPYEDGTLNDYVTNMTATIGEKISFRRFALLEKNDNQHFGSYIHMGGKISVLTLLEGASEQVAKDVSMHAAAMRPEFVKKEDVPADRVEHEKKILTEQAMAEGKPADIAQKMVMGRINKFYKEICLEEQEFVKDNSVSVGKYVSNNGGKIIDVVRFEVGEGIEKRQENFAEEVAAQMKGE
ncbi:MAG TPA: elongation factor Ts [Candidatus Aphodocola excrementigallinarum]|uniref:Elongation factor Ts n=1 Tax=Candidatus Aphodocola excrementigallinarum TaxID=2840670 RepID=A0A9D1IL86_9FIRM|nr:elongation factor Ts [Candidatus Aphodocola excrementigallinarum]